MGETLSLQSWYLRVKPFSILERIDVGETMSVRMTGPTATPPFSILERIDVGETRKGRRGPLRCRRTFSILERIDVGETVC